MNSNFLIFGFLGIAMLAIILIDGMPKDNCQKVRCSWQITNCCPENAGANWECVDLNNFEQQECRGNIACPQVISPKPTVNCTCDDGRCVIG